MTCLHVKELEAGLLFHSCLLSTIFGKSHLVHVFQFSCLLFCVVLISLEGILVLLAMLRSCCCPISCLVLCAMLMSSSLVAHAFLTCWRVGAWFPRDPRDFKGAKHSKPYCRSWKEGKKKRLCPFLKTSHVMPNLHLLACWKLSLKIVVFLVTLKSRWSSSPFFLYIYILFHFFAILIKIPSFYLQVLQNTNTQKFTKKNQKITKIKV